MASRSSKAVARSGAEGLFTRDWIVESVVPIVPSATAAWQLPLLVHRLARMWVAQPRTDQGRRKSDSTARIWGVGEGVGAG
ncbi:MAG: hypothetical protein WDW36_005218 [Sanguina aurantia]